MASINQADVAQFPLPLPSMDEQRRIAQAMDRQFAALGRMEALRAAQLEAIEALPAALLRWAFEEIEAA
jgi:restriction endonuclease S subunit